MKKGFYASIVSVLFLPAFIFGVFITSTIAADKPQYGGTLTFFEMYASRNPISWDNADWCWKHPNDTGFTIEHLMMGDLQKGPRGTNEFAFQTATYIPANFLRGELAESWEVKKNPLRVVFHLRKGVFWQEKPGVMKSREFVADDVAYSMNRVKNSSKAPPIYMDFIDRWEALDKHTVVMHMNEWAADWDVRAAWGYYDAVQAPEQENAPGGPKKWQNVCGTGPYVLTDYKKGHSQRYTKNPRYWDSEVIDGKKYKLPFADKLVMMIVKDQATRMAALRTGKIDLMMDVNWRQFENLKKTNPQLQWKSRLHTSAFMLALRMDTKPFDDIRVRRALNMAVNRQEIIDAYYGGNAILYHYPFPPTFDFVHTPLEKLPPTAKELFTYNPEKAKKLLSEAGYPNGFAFKAQISSANKDQLNIAEMVVAYLARVGVKLELETMNYSSWLNRLIKKAHPAGCFMSAGHGYPFGTMRKIFVSGQHWNASMMSDEHVDKTWKEAVSNPNLTEKEANAQMKKLAVYCIDQAPAVWMPLPYVYTVWWPWVKNYYGEIRVGAQRSGSILARVWIDQELKKKMGFD